MKFYQRIAAVLTVITGLTQVSAAGEVPEQFKAYLEADKFVRAEIVEVITPKEFEKFVQKLSEVAQKDPEWYEEHAKKTPAGTPIPLYDAKLGMSQEEYDKYLKLWDSREAKKIEDVALVLEQTDAGEWKINATGMASPITLLRYNPETGTFKSPNGTLERIADIDAPERSLLGGWSGQEWRYLEENNLTKTKENIALGLTKDKKYGMLIYRLQQVTASGRPLFDKKLVIRFVPKK